MAEFGETLSRREIEVLELVTTGATNRQIAQDLFVSVNTVKVHMRNIFTKLGVESRTEATLIAIRQGLVNVPATQAEHEDQIHPEGAAPTLVEDQRDDSGLEALPPLPWPKRVALIASLLLVTLTTVITWPRPYIAAGKPSDDTDNLATGSDSLSAAGGSTGWRALAPMTLARSRFALVAIPNGQLYAIGGETNGGITGAVERYNPVEDQWTPSTVSKPIRVSNMSAAFIGDQIYVPGGLTPEGDPTPIVEAYNLVDETWSQVAALPRALSSYALAVYDGRVYLFGGKDDRGYVNNTYFYDPQKDKWHEGRAMPTRRAYAAAAALGSRIYVIGGYDGKHEQSTCETYLPEQDTWESCESLTLGRGGLGLAQVANRLYTVGGGWSNFLGFSEEYNPSAADWTPFETPVGRQWRNLAVASTAVSFYVVGGWNGDYLSGAWEYIVLWNKIFIPAASP
jgi:DNA-binding CsgD family transcriptional regulator